MAGLGRSMGVRPQISDHWTSVSRNTDCSPSNSKPGVVQAFSRPVYRELICPRCRGGSRSICAWEKFSIVVPTFSLFYPSGPFRQHSSCMDAWTGLSRNNYRNLARPLHYMACRGGSSERCNEEIWSVRVAAEDRDSFGGSGLAQEIFPKLVRQTYFFLHVASFSSSCKTQELPEGTENECVNNQRGCDQNLHIHRNLHGVKVHIPDLLLKQGIPDSGIFGEDFPIVN